MAGIIGVDNNYTREFLTDVSLGRIPGHVRRNWFGVNLDVDMLTAATIWPFSNNIWQRIAPGDESTFYISSTSASDVQNAFLVTVLDENWVESTQVVVPTGQTPSAIPGGPHLRINDCQNISAQVFGAPHASVGDIYIASEDNHTAGVPNDATKIQGLIKLQGARSPDKLRNGYNTVPAGKTAIVHNVFSWVGKNLDITANWCAAINTSTALGVEFELVPIQIYQSSSLGNLIQAPFPEFSDIHFMCNSDNNNSAIQIVVQSILVDNDVIQS